MMSSNVPRLNIPVPHLLRSWMEKTGMLRYCSQNTGLVSNQITKTENIINWRQIKTNVVLP